MPHFLSRPCLALARLSSAMWIGAAFLFVVTSIAEQVWPDFDTTTKNALALIRFPWYYGTGFTLLGTAFATTLLAGLPPRTRNTAALLLFGAIALMAFDYVFVYRPLVDLLTNAGDVREGDRFTTLHEWSERLNSIGFLLAAVAAGVLCFAKPEQPTRRNYAEGVASQSPGSRTE